MGNGIGCGFGSRISSNIVEWFEGNYWVELYKSFFFIGFEYWSKGLGYGD